MAPRTPRVPGEVVAQETVTEAVESQPVSDLTGNSPVAEETVTVSKASLDALLARVEALESSKQSPSRVAAQVESLPDQSEVNPEKIKTPILTKQGWVVPAAFGSNPAAKAL